MFTECRDGKYMAEKPNSEESKKLLYIESSQLSNVPRIGVNASGFHVLQSISSTWYHLMDEVGSLPR